MVDTIIKGKWVVWLVVVVPKIKSFFQLTPSKIKETLDNSTLGAYNVDRDARNLLNFELLINTDLQADFTIRNYSKNKKLWIFIQKPN